MPDPASSWDLDGAWLFPMQPAGRITEDPRIVAWEHELVTFKLDNAPDILYEPAGNVTELTCSGGVVNVARRNGRIQWYWVQSSLLWALPITLEPVELP